MRLFFTLAFIALVLIILLMSQKPAEPGVKWEKPLERSVWPDEQVIPDVKG